MAVPLPRLQETGDRDQNDPVRPLTKETFDIVLGVDTHKDVHVAAVVTAVGAFVESWSFPTTAEGYEQLLDWARTLGASAKPGWSHGLIRRRTEPVSHHRLRGEPA
ncbi:hypothetical protein GCM10010493_77290 [Streptomyces lavendulae subsp. grasserius]